MQPTTLQSLRLNPTLNRASVAPPPTLSGDRVSLVGAPSATVVDYTGLCEVVTPDAEYRASRDPRKPGTEFLSYQPLPYAQFVDGVRDAFASALGVEPTTESYALAAHGQQFYGIMAFRDPELKAMRSLRTVNSSMASWHSVTQSWWLPVTVSRYRCVAHITKRLYPRSLSVLIRSYAQMVASHVILKSAISTRAI